MKNFKIILFSIILLSSASVASAQTEQYQEITTKVKGITCGNDLKTISDNVEKLEGVSTCKAGKPGANTTFNIVFDPKVITEKEIYAAIENTAGCKDPNEKPYKVK